MIWLISEIQNDASKNPEINNKDSTSANVNKSNNADITPNSKVNSKNGSGDAVVEEESIDQEHGAPEESNDAQKIHIKLKYLNDTLKEVEGSLDELLKDFKW